MYIHLIHASRFCKKLCQEVNNEASRSVYLLDPERCAAENFRIDFAGTTTYMNEVFDIVSNRVGIEPSIIVLPYHQGLE
jgi:hypothetical protein